MKIAIIDSGINAKDNIKCSVVNVVLSKELGCKDNLGHGTLCASIISSYTEDITLYNIKVADDSYRTTPMQLINSIKWAVDNKIDVINLSIGCSDITLYYEFKDICDYAVKHGSIIIAAANNDNKSINLPAYLENVIGVGVMLDGEGIVYKKNSNIQFYTRGLYKSGDYTSLSTAHITGLIAKEFSKKAISYESVLSYLIEKSTPVNSEVRIKENAPFAYSVKHPVFIKELEQNTIFDGRVSFLGNKDEAMSLYPIKDKAVIDFDNIIYFDTNKFFDCKENVIDPNRLNDLFHGSLVIGSVPEQVNNIIEQGFAPEGSVFYLEGSKSDVSNHLFNFSKCSLNDEDNNYINTQKILFNSSVEKKLFINLSGKKNTNLFLQLKAFYEGRSYNNYFMSNDAFLSLFGIKYVSNTLDNNNFSNWLMATIDYFSNNHLDKLVLGWNFDTTCMSMYTFDTQLKNELLAFVTLYLSYNPDTTYIVYDDGIDENILNTFVSQIKLWDKNVPVYMLSNSNLLDKPCVSASFLSRFQKKLHSFQKKDNSLNLLESHDRLVFCDSL